MKQCLLTYPFGTRRSLECVYDSEEYTTKSIVTAQAIETYSKSETCMQKMNSNLKRTVQDEETDYTLSL